MKIIFLDVDGVLNYDDCPYHVGAYYGVDPAKVKLLKQIVDATGAKIILSSTWRHEITVGMPLECQENPFAIELMSKLQAEGLRIYDYTPVDTSDSMRKEQILRRMREYRHDGQQIDGWCVLDDECFSGFLSKDFSPHFVITNCNYDETDPAMLGLTEVNVQQAIKILNEGGPFV